MKKFLSKVKKLFLTIPTFWASVQTIGLFQTVNAYSFYGAKSIQPYNSNALEVTTLYGMDGFYDTASKASKNTFQFSDSPAYLKIGLIVLVFGLGFLVFASKIAKKIKIAIISLLAILLGLLVYLFGFK